MDESGTHDHTGQRRGSEVCVVAGYVAWKDQWEVFCREWQAVTDRFGAPLHMGKLVQLWRGRELEKKSPYVGWSREQAVDFVQALVPIARRNTLFGVGAGVSVRDYESLIPQRLEDEVGHPFHFSFQLLFESLIRDLRSDVRFTAVSNREPVDWLARYLGYLPPDDGEEWETPLIELSYQYARELHWKFHDRETLAPLVEQFIAQRPDLTEP